MNIFDRKKLKDKFTLDAFKLSSITMEHNRVSMVFNVDNKNIDFSDNRINVIYRNDIERYHPSIKSLPIDKLYLNSVEHNVNFNRFTSEIKYVAEMPYSGLYL